MTHKQAVLRLLSDRKPHSHHELYALGCVAHSRISDLRRDGHVIEAWREDGLYLYQLKGALDEAAASPEAVRDGTDGLTAVSSSTPPNPKAGFSSPSPAALRVESTAGDGGVLIFDEHDQATLWDAA